MRMTPDARGLGLWKSVGFTLGLILSAGAASAQTKEKEKERVIELPPMVVEDAKLPPRWRYAALPGMEFLTCCEDDLAIQLIERTHRMTQQLNQFLPPQLRIKHSTPVSFVLFGENSKMFNAEEVVADMQRSSVIKSEQGDRSRKENVTLRSIPNFRFWDRDKLSVFFIMKEDLMGSGAMTLTPGYVRYMLENRAPALPRWFVEGMMALYETAKLEAPAMNWMLSMQRPSIISGKVEDPSVVIGPAMWVNAGETKKIKASSRSERPRLLRMEQIFSTPPPINPDMMANVSAHEEREGFTKSDGVVVLAPMVVSGDAGPDLEQRRYNYQLWRSQAALFLRWALDKDGEEKRAALWRFVEQAGEGAVTETKFEQAFGLNYAGVTAALLDYLPNAMGASSSFSLRIPVVAPPPEIELREPTVTELARIKGDLERLEIGYVKQRYPQAVEHYAAQARRTLRRAYDKGIRDPELLAVMGLCECDVGDDAAGRPFLEAAVKAGVVRPRAYYEMARINYNALRAWEPEAKFTGKQTAELLQPLFVARTQSPPLPEVYLLIAKVWGNSAITPTRAHLAVLDEGVRNFPSNLGLVYVTAQLNVAHGFGPAVAGLIDYGLRMSSEGADRTLFRKLQAEVATGRPVMPAPSDAK
jgi:hypothetical protein